MVAVPGVEGEGAGRRRAAFRALPETQRCDATLAPPTWRFFKHLQQTPAERLPCKSRSVCLSLSAIVFPKTGDYFTSHFPTVSASRATRAALARTASAACDTVRSAPSIFFGT